MSRKEYMKAYREKNAEKMRQLKADWRKKNIEYVQKKDKERSKKRNEELKEGYVIQQAKYYTNLSREEILKYPELIETIKLKLKIKRL
jgi:hypothetical protein